MADSTTCTKCGRLFDDGEELQDHMRSAHPDTAKSGVGTSEQEPAEAKRPDR